MRNMKELLLGVCFLAVSCASSGRQITDDEMKSFVVGQSTVTDIETKLGAPTTRASNAAGTQQISYVYSHAAVKAQTFIPIAGAFIGGANTNSNVVTFMFDQSGVLKDYRQTNGQNDVRTGFASGAQ